MPDTKWPVYMLMKQMEPETHLPWRIAEMYLTCDGPRTRLVNGAWSNEEFAREELWRRQNRT